MAHSAWEKFFDVQLSILDALLGTITWFELPLRSPIIQFSPDLMNNRGKIQVDYYYLYTERCDTQDKVTLYRFISIKCPLGFTG